MEARTTTKSAKNALVVVTSPLLASIRRSFRNTIQTCRVQVGSFAGEDDLAALTPKAYATWKECGIGRDMTERVRIEHDFECSEKAFWDTFLNTEYNKEMFCQKMKFPRWELVKFELTDDEMHRVVEVEPYVAELPGPIKKVIGDSIRYQEKGRLDRKAGRYDLEILPGKLADKIRVKAKQYTQSLGESRCRRIFEAEIEIKVFGIGSMIEKNIASDMRKSYDVGAAFTRDYMSRHGIS